MNILMERFAKISYTRISVYICFTNILVHNRFPEHDKMCINDLNMNEKVIFKHVDR